MKESQRAYVYRVLVALVPLLSAYGLIDSRTGLVWLGLLSAVLGIGLAAMNTSTKAD